jgi:hypothetical protein
MLELYVTGDKIGFYNSVSVSGKSNVTEVQLGDTDPLARHQTFFALKSMA